jgi:hypothetical protein
MFPQVANLFFCNFESKELKKSGRRLEDHYDVVADGAETARSFAMPDPSKSLHGRLAGGLVALMRKLVKDLLLIVLSLLAATPSTAQTAAHGDLTRDLGYESIGGVDPGGLQDAQPRMYPAALEAMLENYPEWFLSDLFSAITEGIMSMPIMGGHKIRPATESKITVRDDPGGTVRIHSELWRDVAKKGRPVEILGRCWSACTMVMTAISRDHLCFGPSAQLGFHAARVTETGELSRGVTQWMFNQYPNNIQRWITKRGGVRKMSIGELWYLTAPELWKMGYSRCED